MAPLATAVRFGQRKLFRKISPADVTPGRWVPATRTDAGATATTARLGAPSPLKPVLSPPPPPTPPLPPSRGRGVPARWRNRGCCPTRRVSVTTLDELRRDGPQRNRRHQRQCHGGDEGRRGAAAWPSAKAGAPASGASSGDGSDRRSAAPAPSLPVTAAPAQRGAVAAGGRRPPVPAWRSPALSPPRQAQRLSPSPCRLADRPAGRPRNQREATAAQLGRGGHPSQQGGRRRGGDGKKDADDADSRRGD